MSGPVSTCFVCGKSFDDAGKLNPHIRKVHKSVKCPNCGETLDKCKDISAVGQAFACKRKNKKK
jgi:predicted RNA-binding Zn-ribbon protein involved in translation (DUF1610 family)